MGAALVGLGSPPVTDSRFGGRVLRAACCVKDEGLRKLPEPGVGWLLARIGPDAKKTGQHADDVAIENRTRLVEGNAGDCASRIATDARQGEDVVKVLRKIAIMPGDDLSGGVVEIANAGVITQTRPKLVQLGGSGFRDRFDRRQRPHPAFPVGDDGFHLGLLEHDLGYPNGIRVPGAPPRKVAGISGKPREQRRHERASGWRLVACRASGHQPVHDFEGCFQGKEKSFVFFVRLCSY